jgi:hypothetical protein
VPWIFGDERIARLRAAGFSDALVRGVTSSSWEVWPASGDELVDLPDEARALIEGDEIVPVVSLDDSSMHYVLLVDGVLTDWGEEWALPVVGGMDRVIAETLITAWENEAFSDERLIAWASAIGYPHAAQLLLELPQHNATRDGLDAWLAEFIGRSA